MQAQSVRTQKGVYLVIVSVLMVVLIGFGALSLDLGRIFVLRTEMQNAADAAAMAAARELGGGTGAITRATAAARFTVEHEGRFADDQELLRTNIVVDYFCAIGSRFDPAADVAGNFCTGTQDAEGRYQTNLDAEAKYVRVSLIPSEDDNTYSLPLIFLPVLNIFLDDVDTSTSLQASAIAGRSFYQCDFAPVMVCNPFESDGDTFSSVMNPGDQVIFRGASDSTPGNYGFLAVNGSGAGVLRDNLADEELVACQDPLIITEPGDMGNSSAGAINTRFDVYGNPSPFNEADAPSNWPPAPNVIAYPRDLTWRDANQKFGNGDWDRETYFATYHDDIGHPRPPGTSAEVAAMTRWEVYNWEIDNGYLPSKFPIAPYPGGNNDTTYDGVPDPLHLDTGGYPPPQSTADRRTIDVAVVNCIAQDIGGRASFTMFGQEGFARVFLTETSVGTGPPEGRHITGEFIEWVSNESSGDSNFYIDVQLYE